MPFGQNCEFKDFAACTGKMQGKVDDPEAYCAVLMRKTETHCKGKGTEADKIDLSLSAVRELCPPCAERMERLGITNLHLTFEELNVILTSLSDKSTDDSEAENKNISGNLQLLEDELRTRDLEELEAYRRGIAPAPLLYKAIDAAFVGLDRAKPEVDEGLMTFVASDEAEDRLGDILQADGWELTSYERNPVYLFGHNHNIPPVGRVPRVWLEGKQLLNVVQWDADDAFAQILKGKYKRGFMKAQSVGFRPLVFRQRTDGKGLQFQKQELLEISAVAVPAHPAAVMKLWGNRQPIFPQIISDNLREKVVTELRQLRSRWEGKN